MLRYFIMSDHIDIDLRGRPGEVKYECPICHWRVTLYPEAVARWTKDGTITPRCRIDGVDLVATPVTTCPYCDGAGRPDAGCPSCGRTR